MKIENQVLIQLLFDNELLHVSQLLKPELFTDQRTRAAISEAIKLINSGKQADTISLSGYFGTTESEGLEYLTNISSNIDHMLDFESGVLMLNKKYNERKLQSLSPILANVSDVDVAIKQITAILSEITDGENQSVYTLKEASDKLLQHILENQTREGLTGIDTGLREVNQLTDGLQKGELIIISGKTSHGKSTLALNFARSAAICGANILFRSNEMTEVQMAGRLLSQVSGFDNNHLFRGKLTDEEIADFKSKSKFLIDRNISLTKKGGNINDIVRQSRAYRAKHGLELLIVDYLQNIPVIKDGEEGIAHVCKTLKELALDLDIPIILLSQLSREGKNRGSGQIEETADTAFEVVNPTADGSGTFMYDGQEVEAFGKMVVLFKKGRNTGIGSGKCLLDWNYNTNLLSNYEQGFTPNIQDEPF